jgi:hypothetical protein
VTASGVIHQSGRRVWRGCIRPPTEVFADGCIGHPDPDFSAEYRRGSGGACRARLVLSAQGGVEERRLRDLQREIPPGARRSTRRPVCGREHCQRTCRAAVGLRRCVVRPRCWPCSTSGPRPDRSGRRCRQPALADAAPGELLRAVAACLAAQRSLRAPHPSWPLAVARARERICGKTVARVLSSHAAARRPRRLPAGCAGSG